MRRGRATCETLLDAVTREATVASRQCGMIVLGGAGEGDQLRGDENADGWAVFRAASPC